MAKKFFVVSSISVLFLCSQSVFAGTKTIITQTPEGEIIDVEKAEVPPAPAFPSFMEADLNGDGRIDPEEARNVGILKFKQADRDGNGYLDQSEYEAAAGTPDM